MIYLFKSVPWALPRSPNSNPSGFMLGIMDMWVLFTNEVILQTKMSIMCLWLGGSKTYTPVINSVLRCQQLDQVKEHFASNCFITMHIAYILEWIPILYIHICWTTIKLQSTRAYLKFRFTRFILSNIV